MEQPSKPISPWTVFLLGVAGSLVAQGTVALVRMASRREREREAARRELSSWEWVD